MSTTKGNPLAWEQRKRAEEAEGKLDAAIARENQFRDIAESAIEALESVEASNFKDCGGCTCHRSPPCSHCVDSCPCVVLIDLTTALVRAQRIQKEGTV